MKTLQELLHQRERLVAGVMSGTSADGVDAVVARLSGTGKTLAMTLVGAAHVTYEPPVRAAVLDSSSPETSSVRTLSQLNFLLADVFAEGVRRAVAAAGLSLAQLDLVGSHGQTVHHVPVPEACAGHDVASTLQIGDPSVLAHRLGVVTVGDFRVADIALGGQGAPLVPYFDYHFFSDASEHRGLLNLGGIANITVLPRGGELRDVYAFDIGPANMVLDLLAGQLFQRKFDADGALAAQGRPSEALLAELLQDPFFRRPPPRSTGRERFGETFLARLLSRGQALALSPHDLLATALAFTVRSVRLAYDLFIRDRHPLQALIVSGGGTRNRALMRGLAEVFFPVAVRSSSDHGVDPLHKEALCFAVLAHETLHGAPTNLPQVTGARRPALLGKICSP